MLDQQLGHRLFATRGVALPDEVDEEHRGACKSATIT
jgi:hypothetical protein